MTEAPRAEPRPETSPRHGETDQDPYRWLKDPHWQALMHDPALLAPDIRAYLDAENAYLHERLGSTDELQEALFAELRGRIKEDDSSVPSPDGPHAYYHRYRDGGQHPIYCRHPRNGDKADEEILLDGDAEASGHSYFDIAACEHSADHQRLAYALDLNGSEVYRIHFKQLDTGPALDDVLDNAQGSLVWTNDSAAVLYIGLDENHRPAKVYLHRLGQKQSEDQLIYEEQDPGFFVTLDQTESRRFILIDTHDHVTSEVWLVDADNYDEAPRLIEARTPELEYEVSHHGERLIIRTNADGAEDYKLVKAPLTDPGIANWQDLVAYSPGVLLRSFLVFKDFLIRYELEDGLPRVIVMSLDDNTERRIEFPEEAYALGLHGSYEFDSTALRFSYSSFATPSRVYDYDMRTRQRVLLKEQEVPSGHHPDDYRVRRSFATSHDGQRIPISILHRVDTPIDGSAPLLLYGYGAYGSAIPASFGTHRFCLVNRGFVFAIAHVRGGIERGYRWYREGKRLLKKNTFLDFVAAAEHLIAEKYAASNQVACQGGSAGGLLIGAVINKRPELFRAAVAEVPFVDVLNTMCDDTLPLTPPEWPEWGNPITERDAYAYIKSYSPYDNVVAQDYPHLLVTAGLTDPRVTYWEPAKWVAKLRAMKTDANLLLLKTNMDAGHAGAAGRFDQLKEIALVYAFLLHVFGME